MSSQTASKKRSRDSESYTEGDNTTSASASPPAAKRVTRSQPTPTDTQASNPIQDDARSSQADEWSTPYDFEDTILHSSFLAAIKIYHRELTVPFKRYMLEALSLYIRNGNPANINKCINAINKWFASYPEAGSASEDDPFAMLQEEWKALLAEINKPQPPSAFARSSHWVRQQKGPAFINCLRPPECSGLPLNLLHPLFAKFLDLIEGSPPDSSDPKFILAEQVAIKLCQEMPRHFDTEGHRLDEFEDIVTRLFEEIGSFSKEFSVGSGRADLVLEMSRRVDARVRARVGAVLIGEGKNEPGGSCGDPYMKVVASYDAWARQVKQTSRIDAGCPCFVFCVDGPNILFGGGFRDNGVSVVEPLSDWCVMMPHVQLKREQTLARHLYALLSCLMDQSKFLEALPSRTAYCPQIYDAFIGLDGQERVLLKFIKPFTNPHRQRGVFDLLFHASAKEETGNDLPAKESSVLVKVPIGSAYGLEPHVLAASARFAPRLLGTASVPGAPVIYVMELLSKSEGWFHLVKAELPNDITERQKKDLRDRGTALITFLSDHQLVHGDLRGCNIMCRRGDNDVDLRVLDWDWAGKRGTARYPAALNTEVGYQGLPGGFIEASHDEDMFRKTLDDFFAS